MAASASQPQTAPPSSSSSSSRRPGLIANAIKRKDAYIQLFLMSGIFMMSVRSLGQKYRIHDLAQDNAELRKERDAIGGRMERVKAALWGEAKRDQSGRLGQQIQRLFGEDK